MRRVEHIALCPLGTIHSFSLYVVSSQRPKLHSLSLTIFAIRYDQRKMIKMIKGTKKQIQCTCNLQKTESIGNVCFRVFGEVIE